MSAILRTERIGRAFGGVQAVRELSMEVNSGTITALIGPNGAGKTTTLNIVSGLINASTGKVFFAEQELGPVRPHQMAGMGLARTFQTPQIFSSLTVLQSVLVGTTCRSRVGLLPIAFGAPQASRESESMQADARKWLEFVGLAGMADTMSDQMAFGKLRFLEIAQSLAAQPKLILMDEPGSGLSPAETAGLRELLFQIRDLGITILLVEHNMKLVMSAADYIIVLDKGQKLAEGCPEDVKASRVVQNAYLGGGVDDDDAA